MGYQSTFKRYELKYMLTSEQKAEILKIMEPYMALDPYGRTTIRNLYYDTDNYRLVRHSIEKTPYKEKLRIRSYAQALPDSQVFVELKKKHNAVVYKRRLAMTEEGALRWMAGEDCPAGDTQISREIGYFRDYYRTLHPVAFLSYEREAYYARDGGDLRITFDEHILCRREALSLEAGVWGTPLLREGMTLMEIKCSGGIPLWMTGALSQRRIYRTSFSKYGTAYRTMIYPEQKEIYTHA